MTSLQGKFGDGDVDKFKQFQQAANPNDKQQQALLEEMRKHVEKLSELRKNEDPRLSFSTPEFKKAQRTFTDNFKKNFGRPVEWAMVKEHDWSMPVLRAAAPEDGPAEDQPEVEAPSVVQAHRDVLNKRLPPLLAPILRYGMQLGGHLQPPPVLPRRAEINWRRASAMY
eukprot:jgi/Tetstr1/466880/TSEL_011335.t1